LTNTTVHNYITGN